MTASHYQPWEQAHDDHLRSHYPTGITKQIATALGRHLNAVYARAAVLGLKKDPEAVSRHYSRINRARSYWNDALDEIITLMYPDTSTEAIAELLGMEPRRVYCRATQLGVQKTGAYLSAMQRERVRRNPQIYEKSHFKPGHKSWNKGMKGLQLSTERTRFKPGNIPPTTVPVGTERWTTPGPKDMNPRSYLQRKVAEPNVWRLVHHIVWEEAHGPIPPGHIVRFKTPDTTDISSSNLMCVTRAENSRMNSPWHTLPRELAELVHLRGQLTRQINKSNRILNQQTESTQP